MQDDVKYPEWQMVLRAAQQRAKMEQLHQEAIEEDKSRTFRANNARVLTFVLWQLLAINIPDLTEPSYVLDDYRFSLGMFDEVDSEIKRFNLRVSWVFPDTVQAELNEYDISLYHCTDLLEHTWHDNIERDRATLARMLDAISEGAAAALTHLEATKKRQQQNKPTAIDFKTREEELADALWNVLRPRIAAMLDERMGEF